MENVYNQWDHDDFKAFLMIHLANVDLETSEEEILAIIENVNMARYKKIKKVWNKCNDYTCLKIIRELKEKHYPGEEGKKQLIAEMTAIAQADEGISTNEQMLISALNRLL
jgi:hypothetical protein